MSSPLPVVVTGWELEKALGPERDFSCCKGGPLRLSNHEEMIVNVDLSLTSSLEYSRNERLIKRKWRANCHVAPSST